MTKSQQIVELQDLIDDLNRMKLDLQSQTGATFSDTITAFSEERSRTTYSGEEVRTGSKQHRKQLGQIRSRLDRLATSFQNQS